jgi:hypothetical protein
MRSLLFLLYSSSLSARPALQWSIFSTAALTNSSGNASYSTAGLSTLPMVRSAFVRCSHSHKLNSLGLRSELFGLPFQSCLDAIKLPQSGFIYLLFPMNFFSLLLYCAILLVSMRILITPYIPLQHMTSTNTRVMFTGHSRVIHKVVRTYKYLSLFPYFETRIHFKTFYIFPAGDEPKGLSFIAIHDYVLPSILHISLVSSSRIFTSSLTFTIS